MEAKLTKLLPLLIIFPAVYCVGLGIALGVWKASGRTVDRDTIYFMAKVFAGIAIFGIVLGFLM
jgi:hypothetical protein